MLGTSLFGYLVTPKATTPSSVQTTWIKIFLLFRRWQFPRLHPREKRVWRKVEIPIFVTGIGALRLGRLSSPTIVRDRSSDTISLNSWRDGTAFSTQLSMQVKAA